MTPNGPSGPRKVWAAQGLGRVQDVARDAVKAFEILNEIH
jgi:hypothetical protein